MPDHTVDGADPIAVRLATGGIRLVQSGTGFRNMFGPLHADDSYRASGLIGADGTVLPDQIDALHRRMKVLALRMMSAGEADPEHDETLTPAGVTYFLQFVAHDMVASRVCLSVDGSSTLVEVRNGRQTPLSLESIYGTGPDDAPQAYAPSPADLGSDNVPRMRLRLGTKGERPADSQFCPARDIGRAIATGLVAPGTDLSPDSRRRWRTDALVADPRNDSHALISQLTILFHLLHNSLLDRIDALPEQRGPLTKEDAYRRFLCARAVSTLIFREVLVHEILPKVLHPDIAQRYLSDRRPLLDPATGVPVEFSYGAFRFGHAMAREKYRVNTKFDALPLSGAFLQTSKRSTGPEPVSGSGTWFVDWRYFFEPEGAAAQASNINRARLIRPRYAAPLQSDIPSKGGDQDITGLAHRDMLSASMVPLWSVPRLHQRVELAEPGLVPGYQAEALKDWLLSSCRPEQVAELTAIAADPPLPFYILWEAEHRTGGRQLGELGSVIVAEAILGAMASTPIVDAAATSLALRIKACCTSFLDSEDVLGDVVERDIKTMARLLVFLDDTPIAGVGRPFRD